MPHAHRPATPSLNEQLDRFDHEHGDGILVRAFVESGVDYASVRPLSGIVSPAFQFGTAARKVGGSAGVPSPASSL